MYNVRLFPGHDTDWLGPVVAVAVQAGKVCVPVTYGVLTGCGLEVAVLGLVSNGICGQRAWSNLPYLWLALWLALGLSLEDLCRPSPNPTPKPTPRMTNAITPIKI